MEAVLTDDALTIAILKDIREELRTTRTELKGELSELRTELKGELHQLKVELKGEIEGTNARLSVVEGALLDLAEQQRFVVRWLKASAARDRRFERDLLRLEQRVDVIEERLGEGEE
jgi:chromosome segregation ATPase